ncbi:MAG: glycosyltransferase family 25 protein [Aestuariivita sp.]|nr:glycosyltransferase family 25 protein [Aestuariivita sp.]
MGEQIPIFVVSLPDAVERRTPLMAQLEEYGLSCEMLNAVDCRDGVPQVFEPLLCPESMMKDYGRRLLPAEVGCALSHHMAYRKIRGGGYGAAIVLEDDAIITRRFAELAKQGVDHDTDMLLLCHTGARVSMKCPKCLNGGSMSYLIKNTPACATSYLVTKRAADYFIKNSLPLSRTADWPVDLTGIKTFAAHPRLVHHPPLEKGAHSYIHHDRSKIVNRTNERNRREKRRGLSRILRGIFFKPSYWKLKMEKQKLRQYKKIS